MAAMPSGLFDAKAARLQIQIVVDENEVVRRELKLAEQTFNRQPCDIHEIERARQFDELGSVPN
jgi:hypothetical protein